jgi:hypothetical protein
MGGLPTARHLLRAKELVDGRYFEPLSVADMAAAAGYSRAEFSRRFQADVWRVTSSVSVDPPSRTRCIVVADHRLVDRRCELRGGGEEHRILHGQFPSHLRPDALVVSDDVAARNPDGAGTPMRGPSVCTAAEPHDLRSYALGGSVVSVVQAMVRV